VYKRSGAVVTLTERPIHYSETLVDVKMRWARWPEEFRRNNFLCVKPAEIYRHIDAVVRFHSLFFSPFKERALYFQL
jgi:hypothetical protein